nr:enoyl-CoA hydratase/isomerase family protein [Sphingomonadaceae bacterium]
MTYDSIKTTRDGDVLTITLNRPERLNAAPPAMFDEIGDTLDHLDGARAVLITGEGRAFCSGADLMARGERTGSMGDGAYAALTGSYSPLMLKLSRLGV